MPAPIQRFLIAPFKSGLQLNVKPWLIMQDAFEILRNLHVWRGRVKKRFGAKAMNESKSGVQKQLFSRLRLKIGATAAVTGNFTMTPIPGSFFTKGQQFSIGDVIYTVVLVNGALQVSSGASTGTFDTGTGNLVITGNNTNPLTDVYYFPAEPVMAFSNYDDNGINDAPIIAWDTQFAFEFSKATGWQRLGTAVWTGDDADFHSIANYRGPGEFDYYLYVVNGVQADEIKFWDGATWTSFAPQWANAGPNAGFVIKTAQFVVPFQNRLLLLGPTMQTDATPTYEYFGSRIIWSTRGDPTANPVPGNYTSWLLSNPPGYASYLDITTKEIITGYQYLKDRLMIFCENSTWELVYQNNAISPFRIQRINTELGVESRNSVVPFDNVVLGFGSNGIHACNGVNVQRIDNDIPDTIFDISNANNGPKRVAGIRDFFTKEVYWSYSSSNQANADADIYPNRVLIYNHDNNTWAYNDDSITAFGYYYSEGDVTWDDLDQEWQESEEQWEDPSLTSLFRNVVAGNQQGFTFIVDSDKGTNSMSLAISELAIAGNIITLTVYNHNLPADGAFIFLETLIGSGTITNLNDTIFALYQIVDENTIEIQANGIAGTYTGGGTIQLVSQIELFSKQYNFFGGVGRKFTVPRLDFLLTPTAAGNVTWNYYATFNSQPVSAAGIISGASQSNTNMQTFPITTSEISQELIWRSKFPVFDGETFQLSITLSPIQMVDTDNAFSQFELHGMLFFIRPTGDFQEL